MNLNDIDPTSRIGQAIIEATAQMFLEANRDLVRDKLFTHAKNQVEKATKEAVDALAREMVEPKIRELLQKGWTQTNTYGEPTGKTISLSERVSMAIEHRSDRVGPTRVAFIEEVIRQEVSQFIREGLKGEQEHAAKEVGAMLDKAVQAAFADSVKKSLGISLK